MTPPQQDPSADSLDAWRDYALEYLRQQLAEAAPGQLGPSAIFDRSPLEGEGATALFRFQTFRQKESREDCVVVVGRTAPNYYPDYGLNFDEAFELHLGTRFMLVMGVAQRSQPPSGEYDMQKDARLIVDKIAPGAAIDDLRLATAFDVDGRLHAVLRCRVAGQEVYIMAADAPHGFSRRADLPPQVAYRLHIGHVLRREPSPDQGKVR